MSDAVRLVLEKDRRVNADQICIRTHQAVVVLEGLVLYERKKHMAEFDTWYVFGVNKVVNKLSASHNSVKPNNVF